MKTCALDLADNLLPSVILITQNTIHKQQYTINKQLMNCSLSSAWKCYRMCVFVLSSVRNSGRSHEVADKPRCHGAVPSTESGCCYSTHCPSSDCRCGEALLSPQASKKFYMKILLFKEGNYTN